MEGSDFLIKFNCYEDDENSHVVHHYRNDGTHSRASTNSRPMFTIFSFLVHLVLVFGYTLIYILMTPHALKIRAQQDSIQSPAREAIQYEKQIFYSPVDGNPFAGPPRPELDTAWHNLLKNMHFRVSKSDLEKIGGRSLELSDGTGYVASLEVYHNLHYLKRIRHYIYKETYFPNVTKEEWARHTFHTEHCLEHFRELAMCRGDIALTTFYYRGHKKAAKLLAEHECVNWDRLENWVSNRRIIDLQVPGIVLPESESESI